MVEPSHIHMTKALTPHPTPTHPPIPIYQKEKVLTSVEFESDQRSQTADVIDSGRRPNIQQNQFPEFYDNGSHDQYAAPHLVNEDVYVLVGAL